MTIATDALRAATGHLTTPLVVVTATDGDTTAGCVVGFHTQTSIEPLRFAVCLAHVNHTAAVASDAQALTVHYLEERHGDLAVRFGSETGDETEKFRDVSVYRTTDPETIELADVPFRWTGTIHQRVDCGDHTMYLLSPIGAHTPPSFRQLSNTDVHIESGHPLP